ncbi:hypothetical protein GLOTRDRAFT_137127 [Gloeophyllum trabeum ATCC 11539]|uniref:Histone H1 n=1 Tax=Gloeophyllum trabeum (strain ATCC 11539 / FP-39264 / Madison 617) TaxID=670483 RepID=S7RYC2_GLOTA|nr:uncharacterized protein GLOTRDRAFT_137127 [Gloeophyllum trabeum ATCC 11539]EPQ58404.1 hypothetical protein GLOTRDRAFT_137127 [Gloeophyllum trabeum ATCC 11539]
MSAASKNTKTAKKPAAAKKTAKAAPAHPPWIDMIKLFWLPHLDGFGVVDVVIEVCPKGVGSRARGRRAGYMGVWRPAASSLQTPFSECIAAHPEDARAGVSRPQIKSFVEEQYKLEIGNAQNTQLSKAIATGVDKGDFVLPKGPSGRVKLAPKTKTDTSATKENKPAKPAAKSAAKSSAKPAAKSTAKAAPAKKPAPKAATAKTTTAKTTTAKKPATTTKSTTTTKSAATKSAAAKSATTKRTAAKSAPAKSAPATKAKAAPAPKKAEPKKKLAGRKPPVEKKTTAPSRRGAAKKATTGTTVTKSKAPAKRKTANSSGGTARQRAAKRA